MGTIQHEVIVVTAFDRDECERFHKLAVDLFGVRRSDEVDVNAGETLKTLVTPMTQTLTNDYWSFTIMPDGSKLGWPLRTAAEEARKAFITTVSIDQRPPLWFHISYGELGVSIKNGSHREDE